MKRIFNEIFEIAFIYVFKIFRKNKRYSEMNTLDDYKDHARFLSETYGITVVNHKIKKYADYKPYVDFAFPVGKSIKQLEYAFEITSKNKGKTVHLFWLDY